MAKIGCLMDCWTTDPKLLTRGLKEAVRRLKSFNVHQLHRPRSRRVSAINADDRKGVTYARRE